MKLILIFLKLKIFNYLSFVKIKYLTKIFNYQSFFKTKILFHKKNKILNKNKRN